MTTSTTPLGHAGMDHCSILRARARRIISAMGRMWDGDESHTLEDRRDSDALRMSIKRALASRVRPVCGMEESAAGCSGVVIDYVHIARDAVAEGASRAIPREIWSRPHIAQMIIDHCVRAYVPDAYSTLDARDVIMRAG